MDRAIDQALPSGCGGCGRSLPRPGTQCPSCQAWPDITREEAAKTLGQPGELTLHRADAAEARALELLRAFLAAAAVPDRLRKQSEIEVRQVRLQEVLEAAGKEHSEALGRLAEAQAAEAAAKIPLDECLEMRQAAEDALESAVRTLAGPKAEVMARRDLAAVGPVLDKYQRLYAEKAAKTVSAKLDVENAEIDISAAETGRDEQAARLLHIEEVRPSARRLTLIAHPLVSYAAEVVADHNSEHPRFPDEWANLKAVVHALAGAMGLLVMAEENALPRVLQDLTGPLSRAGDVAEFHRRVGDAYPHLALPPGPGEASMTYMGDRPL